MSFEFGGQRGLGVERAGQLRGLTAGSSGHTVDLGQLIAAGPEELLRVGRQLADGPEFDPDAVTFLPPLARPPKIICVGLNYADHTKESPYEQPDYPTLFARFATTLVGHNQPIVRPLASTSLDFEGEMVVVIGRGGRHIPKARAHDHVVGYSIFNEGSVREYQFKSPQWTVGKNFDSTGGFGPALVTADEVPAGGKGLRLETRLNGATVQSANTDDMLFDVATLIETISEAITLEPGDLIVSGTPAGIGWARNPRLLMKDGDRCEVSIEGLGRLVNPVCDEVRTEGMTGKAA
ncbi:2-keto-4-pentenoate hydratase/2-oxohepta-3-ene-1,7-dioic acid hydratase in catechol pathway [Mesorhizobium robiniae]|uniref:2-keto-4-pentenoate hydratase/2-oxohepta-3-ene-1,7-dioic acid hydratase in catechol pathway n=1 Tax=Mesorhizobium robiniae TaxID=559315 RepID=A0ABV2GNZ3_9HYPH